MVEVLTDHAGNSVEKRILDWSMDGQPPMGLAI